jgi:DNA-binding transcriptional LysR family regulator
LHVGSDDPRLVPVKLPKNPPDREIWMLLRKDVARLPRVRAVADYLAVMFRKDRRALTG